MNNNLKFTEKDTKQDFERMKNGEIFWDQVRGLNDEHKWWLIHNKPTSSFLIHDEQMTDDMLRECIILGFCNFFKKKYIMPSPLHKDEAMRIINRIKSLSLTEEEWIKAIKNRKIGDNCNFLDTMMLMIEYCADLTESICFEMIKKNPIMIIESQIRNVLMNSDKKYETSSFVIHQKYEHGLSVCVFEDFLIDEDTWLFIEQQEDAYFDKCIFNRDDCPISMRKKAIQKDIDVYAIRDNMTADDIIFWYDLYHEKVFSVNSYFKDFCCNNWEDVILTKPELFQYIPKKTAKICEIAITAKPENIQYVKKPSEKLKKIVLKLKPECLEQNCHMIQEDKSSDSYSAPYYLVTMCENLCDEGDLYYINVIDGKNIQKFLDTTFTVSFGNLDDDKERNVKDCASVQAITENEYQILVKLGLTDIVSGYFNFQN